ncbi:MAG: BatA domain-containing protein [Puniceicoccales bacterium]|jgi:hypothetical protein|nr:BatA domain-containing protein [Puniceicoccales bacterium]
MTFLNPYILALLATVAAPVLIHLFSKPQLRRIRWAATRFLAASLEKNRRRLRVEDLLLLFMRAALVVLLVLIFARPALLTTGDAALSSGETAAAIVIDNSASMGQSDGGETRFAEARAAARTIIGQLSRSSSCSLWLAAAPRPTPLAAKPSQDFALLRRLLDNAAPGDFASDLRPALEAAADSLATATANKEVFVFTDGQSAAWRQSGDIRKLVEKHRGKIRFHFRTIGKEGADNLAVTGLKTSGSLAAPGQKIRVTAEITNHGKTAATKIPVKLFVDGEPAQDEAVCENVAPGETKAVVLFASIRAAGRHTLRAEIPPDRLPADNSRAAAIRVASKLTTLVVDGATANAANTAERDGFFLRNALLPVAPGAAKNYFLQTTAAGVAALEDPAALRRYHAVFLCDVPALSRAAAQNLAAYVAAGGALLVFPGPTANLAFYNTDPDFAPLLPATLAPARDAPEPQKFLTLQTRNYAHPVTELWNEPGAGNLGTVRFSRYYPLTLKTAGTTGTTTVAAATTTAAVRHAAVLTYANNEIAAAATEAAASASAASGKTAAAVTAATGAANAKDAGEAAGAEAAGTAAAVRRGRVLLFGAPATTAWGNLPVTTAFVPLVARSLAYACDTDDPRRFNLAAGQTFAAEVPAEYAGRDISVLRLSGVAGDAPKTAGRVERDLDGLYRLRVKDTALAGAYAVWLGNAKTPWTRFAVQSDPAESDLKMSPPSETDLILKAADTSLSPDTRTASASADAGANGANVANTNNAGANGADVSSLSRASVPGTELWFWFVLAALLLALTETAFAHASSRPR